MSRHILDVKEIDRMLASLHERYFTAKMAVELFPDLCRGSFRKKELKKAKFI